MVPNITKGHNFGRLTEYLTEEEMHQQVYGPMASLAQYLVEPKQDGKERVGFIELVNFQPGEARTPAEAAKVMALTARNAAQLKRAARVKATGRKATAAPVWHLSLSWKPGEEVDKAEMMRSVDNALKTVSLDFKKGYQTIIVQHIDTDHPHVHVQINLVHPVTGKQKNPYKDRERLQVWAHKYDKSRGNTFCEYRAWKYEGHQKELKPQRTMNAKSPAERRVLKLAKKFEWAMNEAAAIRQLYSEKANAISRENAADYQARREAKDALWQQYQAQQAEIRESYRVKASDQRTKIRAKDAQERGRPPVHLATDKEWRSLNRRLRVARLAKEEFFRRHRAPVEKGHRPMVFGNVADDMEMQILLRDRRIARAVTERAIRRRNSADLIQKSKDEELAAAAAAYETNLQQMKVLDAEAKLASRARWRDLSRDRAQAWKDFAQKHGLDEKKREISPAKQRSYKKPKERNRVGIAFARHAEDHARVPDSSRVEKFNWLARQSGDHQLKPQTPVHIRGKDRAIKPKKDFAWASNEATAIRQIFAEKENEISRRNKAAYLARRDAKDALWEQYEQQRTDIYERYRGQIRDYLLQRKYNRGHGLEPKGPTHVHEEKLFRGLNRRLRTAKASFIERVVAPLSKGHRSWLFNNVANDNPQARKDDQKVEQADIRQDPAAHLRVLREAELAKASAEYEVRKQQFKVQGAAQKMASRAAWLRLSQERAQAWKDFANKHGLDEKRRNLDAERPGRAFVEKKDRDRLGRTFDHQAEDHNRQADSDRVEKFNQNAAVPEPESRFDRLDRERHEGLSASASSVEVESIEDRFNRLDKARAEQLEKGSLPREGHRPPKRGRGWER